MSEMVKIHLLNYEGGLPDKIIFFRDGLSEGELERALDLEVDYVKSASRFFSFPLSFFSELDSISLLHLPFFTIQRLAAPSRKSTVSTTTLL